MTMEKNEQGDKTFTVFTLGIGVGAILVLFWLCIQGWPAIATEPEPQHAQWITCPLCGRSAELDRISFPYGEYVCSNPQQRLRSVWAPIALSVASASLAFQDIEASDGAEGTEQEGE